MKQLLLFVLLLPSVFALSGRIPLLALTEFANATQVGSATELSLEVRDGSERVFLETIPLTKITTQISMRFAQQIACHEFALGCNDKDFFFAIKALPGPIVGGPSAGAAAAVLVAVTLNNASLDSGIAMTGTINSGGLIGPVGGIDKKIQAAAAAGYRLVLIPAGARFQKNPFLENSSDLFLLGSTLNISVREVATLREAYSVYTGKSIPARNSTLFVDSAYGEMMKRVAGELCSRTAILRAKIPLINDSRVELVENLTIKAAAALVANASYSAASFCFRGNILSKELANQFAGSNSTNITRELDVFESQLAYQDDWLAGRNISTLTDLQTFVAVNDRLREAHEGLAEARVEKQVSVQQRILSYAEERLVSAKAWSRFFELPDKYDVALTADGLKKACVSKVSEAEERYNYVRTVLPDALRHTRRNIERAYIEYNNQSFVSCIGSASKAKAEADVVMGLLGVADDRLDDVLAVKLELVRQQLLRSQEEGVFPIIGYSYYEYAQSLASADISSALLFAEYALELSDLGIYFQKPKKVRMQLRIDLLSLGMGLLIGVLLTGIYYTVAYRQFFRKRL